MSDGARIAHGGRLQLSAGNGPGPRRGRARHQRAVLRTPALGLGRVDIVLPTASAVGRLAERAEARGVPTRHTGLMVEKHDAHRFDIDHAGKDSHRFAAAGAEVTLIAGQDKMALVRKHAVCPPVQELIASFAGDLDLVLVEGWKTSALPRIEVHRPALGKPLLSVGAAGVDPRLVAVAADGPVAVDVPVLDLNDPSAVLDFILERFVSP